MSLGGMKVSAPDGVKVYNVTAGKTLPQWLSEGKKKSLRKDEEFRKRIDLIQGFDFQSACQRLKITPDEQHIFATGYHPPQVHVYQLSELSMKFERHFDAEIVDFQVLTEGWDKAAFLCADRSIQVHARYGAHHKVRIPKHGRDLGYAAEHAELLVVGSSPEVYRLSLAEGRFLSPLTSSHQEAFNACCVVPAHGMLAAAGEEGVLECFDPRERRSIGHLDVGAALGRPGVPLTALRFDNSGLCAGVGTQDGLVALFDLRASAPLVVKDHMYGQPIRDVKFHASPLGGGATRHVISADTRAVKVWDRDSGTAYTTIETAKNHDINDMCVWSGSGLIMVGCNAPRIQAFFVPTLGPAPKWCSFLEGLTEEMEETAGTAVYDDYRFVTAPELKQLGLTHLQGTALLRAYMHGFFIDNRLYNKAKAIAEPFSYETYLEQRKKEKLEAERASRITAVKKLPKVNAKAAARMLAGVAAVEAAEGGGGVVRKRDRELADAADVMADPRFGGLFADADFAIDERSKEYKALHPNAGKQAAGEDDDLLR